MFLNSKVPYEAYKEIVGTRFFVDKTFLIHEILSALETDAQKYVCITRPRRFGKTVMANMLGAFFTVGIDAGSVFKGLTVTGSEHYQKHLNKHPVMYIDFSEVPRDCVSYSQYIERIQNGINRDLAEAYPELGIEQSGAVWDILTDIFQRTGDKFVFIMDEWDAIFHMSFVTEKEQKDYLLFLRALLKSKGYVQLAYMTGVLPIAKYSDGSELNMFMEYDMGTKTKFSEYFGFLDREVDDLFDKYCKTTAHPQVTREELKDWYDGYYTAGGVQIYNPRSVVCALGNNQLGDYWTSSGRYDSIYYYVRENIEDTREDIALLVAGEQVEADLRPYAVISMEFRTKAQIYSAMVVYGMLTYQDGKIMIPNKELMMEYNKMLIDHDTLGYVHRLAKESKRMLKATLAGDTQTMANILKLAHDSESPILAYNSEAELSAVVNLVYLAARDRYRVEREDKAGEGYVDFIFYPQHMGDTGMILELKVGATPGEAIRQIRDRNYVLRFRGKLGEQERYTGRILAVGISYDRKTKEHVCRVEEL